MQGCGYYATAYSGNDAQKGQKACDRGDKADKIRGIRAIVVKSELLIAHFLHLQNQLNCRQ